LDDCEAIAAKINASRKYRDTGVPEATIRSLAAACLAAGGKKDAEKRARVKLHNIVAPYLGDLDYDAAVQEFEKTEHDECELAVFCYDCLDKHASTRERGRDIADLYARLFGMLGDVKSVCDLACGLHPVGLPFMGLPRGTVYCAYDLNKPRAKFLDAFIKGLGYGGGCFHRDIYIDPPPEAFDVAFFFKEAHRLEKRETGATIKLIGSINAKKFVVSLPVFGMNGGNRLSPRYGEDIRAYADANGYAVETMEYNNEMFYVIDKTV